MDGGCWNAGFLHRPETRFLRVDGISARFCIGGIAESIAQPGLRQNILRILGIALDLFAKHPHVGSQVVSDPYEEPLHPDLILYTNKETPEESARKTIDLLVTKGYVDNSPTAHVLAPRVSLRKFFFLTH